MSSTVFFWYILSHVSQWNVTHLPGKSETDMTRHDKKKKTSKQENGQAKKQIMLYQSENPGLLIHFYNCSFPLKDSFALSTTLVCTNSTTRIMKRNWLFFGRVLWTAFKQLVEARVTKKRISDNLCNEKIHFYQATNQNVTTQMFKVFRVWKMISAFPPTLQDNGFVKVHFSFLASFWNHFILRQHIKLNLAWPPHFRMRARPYIQ